MGELITRSDDAGICTLSLNRAETLNALSPRLFEELDAHLQALAGQTDDVGCVILRGEGRSFSAGNDLKAMQAGERASHAHYQTDVIEALEQLPQPVVGAIRGHCYTGALELALACDLLIVSDTARFADTHASWGMVPMWGMTARLPHRLGLQRAKELMFTGRVLSGAEAVEWGLACACVPDDALEARAREMAAAIVEQSWHSLRAEKALVREGARRTYAEGLAWERDHSNGVTPDLKARLARFGKK